MAEQTDTTQTGGFYERLEDFFSLYANNFQIERTIFDLKLIFGQLSESGGKLHVEQHSSVTLPWIQAKLLMYFLQMNIAGFEFQNGKIKIPTDLLPPPLPPLSPEQENDPKIRELLDLLKSLREQFVSNL